MLHKETVDAKTLALIKKLMKVEELHSFRLVGGTALALQLGHRASTDIDLFTLERNTDFNLLLNVLNDDLELTVKSINRIGIFCYIENIKTDIVRSYGTWLKDSIVKEKIRMASLEDIAAMKINAICGRGKKRDFFDIHELLNHYKLSEILEFYHSKYPNSDTAIPFRSLTYFEDAEDDSLLKNTKSFNWSKIKKTITTEVRNLFKS